jgi:hypothetical protein
VTDDWTLILPPSNEINRGCVVGLGCIESSFLCQSTPCIRDFSDINLAPLLVFLQYLTQPEVGKLLFLSEYSPHKSKVDIPLLFIIFGTDSAMWSETNFVPTGHHAPTVPSTSAVF